MVEKTIYVRARPEIVQLTETYFCNQEISRNPSTIMGQAPSGQIKIVVPYDGHQYFTIQAYKDVKQQVGANIKRDPVKALIGHLLLANYGRTSLKETLALSNRYGSVPLLVPVSGNDIIDADHLRSDQFASAITHSYTPHWPEVTPVTIDMELLDEDTLSLPSVEISTKEGAKHLGNVVAQIAQQVSFRRNLLFIIQVTLNLPRNFIQDGLNPKITRVSLGWPTITSFRALNVFVEDIQPDTELPLKYNPSNCSLEWGNVTMDVSEMPTGAELQTYTSKKMYLLIDQPGELYQRIALSGCVEVEIPGQLLSGTQARVYGGGGKLIENLKPELTTRIITDLNLILDDSFARRTRSPYQHLHFDEVIPDEMRIADIKTALADQGFRITQDVSLLHGHDELKHFILARRPQGPDTMKLWVFIDGKRYTTQRQTQISGGQTYTSTFESGEIKIYMRGELTGDSRDLVKEMNTLQVVLRDRFERLRAKR